MKSRSVRKAGLFFLAAVACFLALAPPAPVGAAELRWSAGYGLEFSDNARRTAMQEESETVHLFSAGLILQQSSRELDARVGANTEYRVYQNEVFPNETVSALNAAVLWHVSPERFSWALEDVFTQTAVNPLLADTPSNRQDANVFSTGPDFEFRLGPVHSLEVGGRYTRSAFEQSLVDNTRGSGHARWLYRSSPRTTLSLNYLFESTEFEEEAPGADFDRRDGFLQLTHQVARNRVVVDLGRTVIEPESGAQTEGALQRFSWTREIGTTSTFSLTGSSQLTDVAREILARGLDTTQPTPVTPITVVTSEVFTAKRFDAVYSHKRSYGDNTFRLFGQRDEYETTATEERKRGEAIEIGYDFSEALTSGVFASHIKTDNERTEPSVTYTDTVFGIRLLSRWSQTTALGLELTRGERKSDSADIGYRENRLLLMLAYTSLPSKR